MKIWCAPMLATLTNTVFSDPGWIYERKLDGMRCILIKYGKDITIWSRNKKIQNNVFPELVVALKKYNGDFILDCEVVIFAGNITSFEKLQNRMHIQNPDAALIKKFPVVAYIFDIMYLNGYGLTDLPLLARKKILRDNFKFTAPFKYLPYRKQNGTAFFQYACKHNWEGLIGKQADAPYAHKRSKTWLKFKCHKGQEFVIGGYTQPKGHRIMFGALLVGYYRNGAFKYAGKVGTGFNEQTLKLLLKKMQPLQIGKSPFINYQPQNSENIRWIKPKLVVELSFTEWTSTGSLRHPSYLGLRNDKAPTQVYRED